MYDDAVTGKRPGVIVVHEWWGLNDYAQMRARMPAKLGYVAYNEKADKRSWALMQTFLDEIFAD